MLDPDAQQFGKAEADRLLKQGWVQGQVLSPDVRLPAIAAGSMFVVCTQSCSVVSESLDRDPFIELAEARLLNQYNRKCDQARGKDVRKFHIPVENAEFKALEVNINTRQFVRRELLLELTPVECSISKKARRDFAGWLGRYYTRIDLPNELVSRLRIHVQKDFEKFLKGTSNGDKVTRHDRIGSIWITYDPDSELGYEGVYKVKFLMLCDDADLTDQFSIDVQEIFGSDRIAFSGLNVQIEVNSPDETLMSELIKHHRFTDWDHLSGMWDAASSVNI